MKKGYKRLLVFEILLFLLLILNSFVWNILDNLTTTIMLVALIFIFKSLFGLEKDRHRHTFNIVLDTIIVIIVAFLFYYLLGIIIGFYKITNYYNLKGITTLIIPITIITILKEYLRYQFLMKSEENNILITSTTILFVLLDISTAIYYANFSTSYNAFLFVALTLIPSITKNISASYIALKTGYKPNIIWNLIINLYIYLIPIIPNPNEYILSILRIVFPLIVMIKVIMFFDKETIYQETRTYKRKSMGAYIISTIFIIAMVYITSGYFKYQAIAIASGSMSPKVEKGDVVIIEKVYNDFNLIKEGTVIAYKYNDSIIVHRVVNIVKDKDEIYFYTKGDRNNNIDNLAITKEMIIGIVNVKIPYIGIPSVLLNEL